MRYIRTLPFLLSWLICLAPPLIPFPSCHAQESSYSKGVLAFNKGDYERALSLLQSALSENRNKADIHYYIALCHQKSGRSREAVSEFALINKQFPNTRAGEHARQALSRLAPQLLPRPAARSSYRAPDARLYVARFEIDPESKHIYVDATINHKPTKMLFDTGAAVTTCTQEALDELGVAPEKLSKGERVKGVGGEVSAYKAVLRISVGGLAREVPSLVQETANSGDKYPILGQTFFKDLFFEVDWEHKELKFALRRPGPLTASGREIPYRTENGVMIVRTLVNKREIDMVLDTGAELVTYADRHLAKCGLTRPVHARYSEARRAIGGRLKEYIFEVNDIQVGPVHRFNVSSTTMLHTNFGRPLLGLSFLHGQTFQVDPQRKMIRFE